MYSKTEKKLMGVKKLKIQGIPIEIKKVSPEDFLGKEGIPISRWQSEYEFIANKQKENQLTLGELKKLWKATFKKSIISIFYKYDDLPKGIDLLIDNYFVASAVYSEIVNHCLGLKKNSILRLFQKQQALR